MLALALSIGSAATSNPEASAADLPGVLCKKPRQPGDVQPSDPGIYSLRPHVCVLEYFEAPSPHPVFVPVLGMRWHRWDSGSAFGLGYTMIPAGRFFTDGRRKTKEPLRVTLSRPRSICGREIFTAGRIVWEYGPFDEHTRIDRVPVPGRACAPS